MLDERTKHAAVLRRFEDSGMYFDSIGVGSGIPNTRRDSILIEGDCGIEELEAFLYFLKKDEAKTKAQPPEEVDADTGPWLIRSLNEFQRLVERVRNRHSQGGRKIPHTAYIEAIPGYVKADVHHYPSGSVEKLVFYTVHDVHASTPEQVNATRLKQKDQQ